MIKVSKEPLRREQRTFNNVHPSILRLFTQQFSSTFLPNTFPQTPFFSFLFPTFNQCWTFLWLYFTKSLCICHVGIMPLEVSTMTMNRAEITNSDFNSCGSSGRQLHDSCQPFHLGNKPPQSQTQTRPSVNMPAHSKRAWQASHIK